jgi:ABC-type transport system substrate-binding protein
MQVIAADLAKVGIKGKFIELEGGTFSRNYFEKKFRGIFRLPGFWSGMLHPGPATESRVSGSNLWSYYTTPEIEAAWKKLVTLSDETAIAAQARELSRIWHRLGIKPVLWAVHQPFGISARVKSYHPVAGWAQVGGLEYLELKE